MFQSACIIEDAHAPYQCDDHEVLVNVKAASVQSIDAQICSGYGKNLSRILRRIFKVNLKTMLNNGNIIIFKL